MTWSALFRSRAGWLGWLGLGGLVAVASRCGGGAAASASKAAPAAATVEGRKSESDLPLVKLTEATERRLGIETAKVIEQPLRRTRDYAGEVVASPDGELLLRAPVGGTVRKSSQPWPQAGAKLQGAALILAPRLAVEREHPSAAERTAMHKSQIELDSAQVAATTDLAQAQLRVDAARVVAQRADELLASGADSVQARDDAQVALVLAEGDVAAAQAKVALFAANETQPGTAPVNAPPAVIPIGSATLSQVLRVHVVEGQEVAAGEPLLTLVSLATRYVAVALPSGELRELAKAAPATVRALGAAVGAIAIAALPVDGPPRADLHGATVTRWFELATEQGAPVPFALGERVVVRLARTDVAPALTVPASALVHDAQGGTWVYVRRAAGTYARARVDVSAMQGDVAWLAQGPAVGSEVVTVGVAELFGVEFGAGK